MRTKVIDIMIKLNAGGKSIELNPEETRDVYEQLHNIFGKEYQPEVIPWNPNNPWTTTYDTTAKKPE